MTEQTTDDQAQSFQDGLISRDDIREEDMVLVLRATESGGATYLVAGEDRVPNISDLVGLTTLRYLHENIGDFQAYLEEKLAEHIQNDDEPEDDVAYEEKG